MRHKYFHEAVPGDVWQSYDGTYHRVATVERLTHPDTIFDDTYRITTHSGRVAAGAAMAELVEGDPNRPLTIWEA